MSRNSITPSRALRTIGDRVLISGGSPFGPGRQSRTPQAQLATGFGEPSSSTRHMRQLPAIDSRSWKQKRGISAPAASQAWSSVYSGGTSISLPSTMSLVILVSRRLSIGCASRRLPQLRGRHALPAEGLVARPVRRKMFEALFRFVQVRLMPGRDPPHDEMRSFHLIEPIRTPSVEALVNGLPDETLKGLDAFPHRQIDRHLRIGERPEIGGVAAVVFQ